MAKPTPKDGIETTALLEGIANPNSNRVTKNYVLEAVGLASAERLRDKVLESFKVIHEINIHAQQANSQSKGKITSAFRRSKENPTLSHSSQAQEALAYIHRELTNLISGSRNDSGNGYRFSEKGNIAADEAKFNELLKNILQQGLKKMPNDVNSGPLKAPLAAIKVQLETNNAMVAEPPRPEGKRR